MSAVDLEGAHVFNLAGDIISMDDFIATLDNCARALRADHCLRTPGAGGLPHGRFATAAKMSRNPEDAVCWEGIEQTFTIFDRLRLRVDW